MKERRWPWSVSAMLLITSGLLAGWSTYVLWLPCPDVVVSQGPFGDLLGRTGFLLSFVDYLVMFAWSGSYHEDGPPGAGYLSALIPVVAGAAIMIIGRPSGGRRPACPVERLDAEAHV